MHVRMPLLRALLSSGMALCLALPALADQPPAPDVARVQSVREKVRADRQSVVLHNMKLDAAQTAKFLPVYGAYAKELAELARTHTRMVVAAINQGDTPTEPQAKQAAKDYLSLADAELKLLRKYHPKMVKAVGPVAAARFLDVEDKLYALGHYDMAWASPLTE